MKKLYRCEYCDFTGDEHEVEKHERECIHNYKNKGCYTCKHCSSMMTYVNCKLGKDVPEGKYICNCSLWEKGEPSDDSPFAQLFGGIFK
jgi:hypothetical protein